MSEAPVYGRSYWDMVTRAFRRNAAARAAFWVSILFLWGAILTPLLSNDRPYAYRGTMPGEYRRAFSQVSRGATLALLGLPGQFQAERAKFQERKGSLLDLLKRMTLDEVRTFQDTRHRLLDRAEKIPAIRGRWISQDVTIEEIEAELTPEERLGLDAARLRILRDLPGVYRQRLGEILDGLAKKLDELADQIGGAARAADVLARFREATAGDYVLTSGERRPLLEAARESFRAAFDPDTVVLLPAWRFPVFDSLSTLDAFLVVGALLALFGFGPLAGGWLRRIEPVQRRWLVQWAFALVPAAVAALGHGLLHQPRFETVSYKTGFQEGSIVAETAWWPPHRFRYDEVPEDAAERLKPPSAAHPLGTDFMGRDLLARMLWGSRISLSIGFVSTAIAVAIGIVIGALAGFYGGWVDMVVSRFIEWMICFPRFFLILAVVAFLPPNIFYVMLVLGLFGWMGVARLQRGEFLRLQGQDYVSAAAALGAREGRIMFRHLLPNSLAPVLVTASFGIAGAMLTESGLSFLGFGVQEPATSWGQILFTAHGRQEWWLLTFPGAAIFVAVTCYNLVGDGIRDAVDPRMRV